MSTSSPTTYLRLHESDNVVIALKYFATGEAIEALGLTLKTPVPFGHKIAIQDIAEGQAVQPLRTSCRSRF